MKEGIHPKYEQTTIRCACGEIIETGSTKKDIKVEIKKTVRTAYRCGLFSYFFRENTQLLPPAAPVSGCGEPSQNFGGSHAAE